MLKRRFYFRQNGDTTEGKRGVGRQRERTTTFLLSMGGGVLKGDCVEPALDPDGKGRNLPASRRYPKKKNETGGRKTTP